MEDILSAVKNKFDSNKLEDNIEGIDLAISIVNSLSLMALKLLEKENTEKLLLTERISSLFYDYIQKLVEMTKASDPEVRFWSSSLIVHYQINQQEATSILLDAVKNDDSEKAYVAATILARVRNISLIAAINERFRRKHGMDNEERLYFEDKITLFNS